ncbi:MAG: transcription-repair coupling factor (superfamily II helicase) [Glaciecola sp.]|jgi:transcription-repair coupling factor (superfamily II helicase)
MNLFDQAASAMAAVTDPGLAVGPLAALLRHGRDSLQDTFEAPDLTVTAPARAFVLSLLAERATPLLVVTPRLSDAETLADGMAAFLGDDRVAVFPPWETLPHERLSPQPSTVGRRLAVLDRLVRPDAHPSPLLAVVAPVRAVLQPMDPALAERHPILLNVETDKDFGGRGLEGLVQDLARLGYNRTAQVEQRGEFAVRGGIVDIFPTAGEHAVRVEFWGDDIDTLRWFSVADQRSVDPIERVQIDPARELVLDDDLRDRARALGKRHPTLASHLDQLADGIMFEGVESLVTLVRPRTQVLAQFLPPGAGLALIDPVLLGQRSEKLIEEAEVLLEVAWETIAGHKPEDTGFSHLKDVVGLTDGPRWAIDAFGTPSMDAQPWPSFRGDVDAVGKKLGSLLHQGMRVVATTTGRGPAQRLVEVLAQQGAPGRLVEACDPDAAEVMRQERVEVVPSPLGEGFIDESLGLAIIAEHDLFGPRRRGRASRRIGARKAASVIALELDEGDPVVHRTHGVGVFRGMVTREIRMPSGDSGQQDFVKVEYAKGDMLFVPSDQIDALSRYQGGESPKLMNLGGAQWEKAKNRVRSTVRDIAAELIRLYAARMHSPGNAFSPDGTWQAELEDAFRYVETHDQLTVTDEIKRDMEAPLPMDRLLAGDVGFGKTEVAVRAAAKAAFDGKQVAILVPTTILAQQHFETFKERFAGFPVDIRLLSRFVTAGDRRDALDGIAAGTIDIVIGTHALIAKSVTWKDLGLIVVDEEQRFGVSHKERLKQMRTSVDVLTMSATPIPRTMEMAIAGIRDMSVIETAPEDRQPVMTVVQEFDEAQVALAIRRELLRDGQIFYVHNQVDTIEEVAAWIHTLVPDARVQWAHGQMEERKLERVMVGFWQKDFDVLVCTTIIESGLDIPNANTLIIERADLLGLSQLHQLRGRVGRSSERGYAYLLYPGDARITEEAYKRLETLAENTRLGSGLQIAMRDLEIRGAGNVIGAEQSGHVAAVGFEMYSQLLKEEVADLTGESVTPEADLKVDLPINAHLPNDYVQDAKQRLELYKKISAVRDAAGVKAVRAELRDRFGPLPEPAQKLVSVAALKAALRRWGVEEVAFDRNSRLRVAPVHLADSGEVRLERLFPSAQYKREIGVLLLPTPATLPDDLVGWVAKTLRELLTGQ